MMGRHSKHADHVVILSQQYLASRSAAARRAENSLRASQPRTQAWILVAEPVCMKATTSLCLLFLTSYVSAWTGYRPTFREAMLMSMARCTSHAEHHMLTLGCLLPSMSLWLETSCSMLHSVQISHMHGLPLHCTAAAGQALAWVPRHWCSSTVSTSAKATPRLLWRSCQHLHTQHH